MCGVKVNRGSEIRSRILEFLSSETGDFEMETNEWLLNWLVQRVKSVTEDFLGGFVVQWPVLGRGEFCLGNVGYRCCVPKDVMVADSEGQVICV